MIGSCSTADHYANGDLRHFLRAVRAGGIHKQFLFGSVRFGAYSRKMIFVEVGWTPAIQFIGGRSAYNVVDDAS
jgi:hypothetical protein